MFDLDSALAIARPASTLLLHSVALAFFLQTLYRVTRESAHFGDISLLLKAFLALWAVESFSALPTSLYAILYSQSNWIFDFPWLFYMVILERSVSCALPVAVFFLSVDRSLTLGLGLGYRRIHRTLVFASSYASAALLVAVCAYLYVRHLSPSESRSQDGVAECWRTVCFFQYPDDFQFLVRIVFGAANVACSLAFFSLLRKYNQKNRSVVNSSQKRRGNAFIQWTLSSELLLNSIPHLACVLYQFIAHAEISQTFGTYSRVLIAIDGVVCATAYRRTKTMITPTTTAVTVTPASGPTRATKRAF